MSLNSRSLFVEKWVIGNLLVAVIGSILVYSNPSISISWLLMIYAIVRVFEIVIYQLNVTLFDPLKPNYSIESGTRLLILLLINYIEMIFWYTIILLSIMNIKQIGTTSNWISYVTSSFYCFSTYDSNRMLANGDLFLSLVSVEIVTGLIMSVLSLARCISLLPVADERRGKK
ncbi:hypothetical protein FHR92_003224 [Fontibacillus solani]|uniref:Potassium channel domain-containing protein n=1 Tax=Fontibacillus solani TaxID=1572857 RepID=A0A7W3SV84_9BACL|nr:hypothetical protein [Fontibacillus solani]